jgi:hypothetical protein
MRILLLCAATFAAGLLAGTLIWPDPGAPQRRERAEGARDARPPDLGPGVERASHTERRKEGGRSGTAEAERLDEVRLGDLASEASDEIDRITTSAYAEPVLAGEGTISGTVRDPSGRPVAGVMVTAVPEAQPFGLSLSARRARERAHEDRDLSTVAGDAIQGELWRRYARRTASTTADGRFELAGLMDARHTLTAFHEGFDLRASLQQGKVVPDAVVDFVARPVVEVRVEVRMADGSLAEHAWLSWQGPHGTGWGAWTRDEGKARLPVGSCKVKAQTSVPEPLQSPEVEHEVAATPSDTPLVLQLEGRQVLTARLVLPEGFVTPGTVEYRLRLLADGVEVDAASLLDDKSSRPARSRSPGRAFWLDLEPGRYLVAAFLDRRRLLTHAVADVGDGSTEVPLVVAEPDAAEYVAVKLLGPDGGPLPGTVSFHIRAGPEGRARYRRVEALQRDDLVWLVLLSGIDTKGVDRATLRVATKDYGAVLQQFRLTDGGMLTIRIDRPARLRLRVQGYGGSGLEGHLFFELRDDRGAAARGQVKPDGRCDLSAVQPGNYELILFVHKNNNAWSLLKQRIGLGEGEDERAVAIPRLHTVRVRVAGKIGARNVTLRSSDPAIGTFRRNARLAGRVATFDALAAGSYEIECGKKRGTVRVPGPPEVTLE